MDKERILKFLEELEKYHEKVTGLLIHLIVSRNIKLPDSSFINEFKYQVQEETK